MVKVVQNPLCPICFSDSRYWDSSIAIDASKRSKKEFSLYKCNTCGHGFFYPGVKDKNELGAYYNEEYAREYNPDLEEESFKLRKEQYTLDLNLINEYIHKDELSVLDYGCSTGQFLNVMPSNWKKHGYEVNKFELSYIMENYKDITTFSKISEIKDIQFDLITLRGVIEHLFDFDDLFYIINKTLRDDGYIFICATPDFNSPCAHVYKSKWNQITAPIHYHQFTSASITILFVKHKFGLRNLIYPYLETPYSNFLEDSQKFFKNIERFLENKDVIDTAHAYPGNMMSLIFKKIK